MPLIDGHVGDRTEHADASVVDQDVEAAEVRDRLGDRDLGLRVGADVGGNRQHAAARGLGAELAGGGVEPRLIGRA